MWKIFCEGKNITDIDILFLQHEYYEFTLMKEKGYNYNRAHNITNKNYNWWERYQKGKEIKE